MSSSPSSPTERAHARLSASGSKRWMACPGSATLTRNHRSTSSKYAMLGTAAHTLGEIHLSWRQFEISPEWLGKWIDQEGNHWTNEEIQAQGYTEDTANAAGIFQVDQDMVDAVEVYLGVIKRELERLGPAAELQVEHKFDLSWLRPGMFGTNDCNISLITEELVIVDYKHGQGVPVEVEKNPQLMYYALGAAHAEGFIPDRYKLILVQPRCPHPKGGVRTYEFDRAELLAFRDLLAAAADQVMEADERYDALDDGVGYLEWEGMYLEPGSHCKDSFCPLVATCNAAHRKAMELAQADFADPPEPLALPDDPEKIRQIVLWAPFLDNLIKKANAELEKRMLNGLGVEGFKWVRGKANRRWTLPEDQLVATLEMKGYTEDQLYETPPPKLVSPAKFEKLGKEAKKLIGGFTIKDEATGEEVVIPPLAEKGVGKMVIAPVDDPRPEEALEVADYETEFPDTEGDEG